METVENKKKETVKERIIRSVKEVTPGALRTAWWLIKIMFCVTFGIMWLRYFGILQWISLHLTPAFSLFGLPGEASLAYVSGFFVNCYSALAVMLSLDLDARATTILAVMVLCSHNIIMETAVQRKTGSSAVRMVVLRTLSAVVLGWTLNKLLPGQTMTSVAGLQAPAANFPLGQTLLTWLVDTLKMAIPMVALVFSLTVLQRLLAEFGVIRYIAKFLRPVMVFFGLPPKTAFLWIVANILGLAYGAAVMMDETRTGKVTRQDADLLNHHICVSHSNLEDLLLFTAVGASLPWVLFVRWGMSLVLVWERRLEYKLNLIKQQAATKM